MGNMAAHYRDQDMVMGDALGHKTKPRNKKHMKTKTQKQIIWTGFVAGLAYSDYQLVVGIKPGRVCKLFWERSNIHDPNAIRVEIDGVKVGYIPRRETYIFHDCRGAGKKVTAEVKSFNKTNETHRMLCIECSVQVPVQVKEDVAL